jgi:hypothetical protein
MGLNQITIDHILIMEGDADPTTGGGVAAPVGSLLIVEGTPYGLFQKTGASDTDWTAIGSVGSVAWGAITGTLSDQTDLDTALNGKEPLKGADDNYVTDAEKVVIGNTSGTNTGDDATNSQYSGLAASKQDADTQLTSLAALAYTGNALKVIRVNAGETDFELVTPSGGSGLAQYQVRQLIRR